METMTKTKTERAVLYARISQDELDNRKAVDRQLADVRQLAGLRGYDVVEEYVENDVSAFADRPEYERMIRDVRDGTVDVIVVYSTSRLWRQRSQRGAAIDQLGQLGVRIEAVSGPSLDLGSATGRYLADVIAGGDTRESEEKGERVARAAQQRAEEGRANGVCPYGWERVYEHDDRGRVVSFHDVEDPDAADVVREAVRRVAEGEAMRAIARDFEERGLRRPTKRTKVWRHSAIRKLVLRPGNIGKRVHRGEIIGDAEWPALVDPVVWQKAVDRLNDGSRRTNFGPSTPGYLLTGLSGAGRCGVCGTELRQTTRTYKRKRTGDVKRLDYYLCNAASGCVGRQREPVDELVTAVVLERLAQPDALASMSPPPPDGGPDPAELEQRLDDAADAYAEGAITRDQLTRITDRLRPQIEEARTAARRAEVASEPPPPQVKALAAAEDAAPLWGRLTLDERRSVLAALGLTVKIVPTRPGPGFEPSDVHFEWEAPS